MRNTPQNPQLMHSLLKSERVHTKAWIAAIQPLTALTDAVEECPALAYVVGEFKREVLLTNSTSTIPLNEEKQKRVVHTGYGYRFDHRDDSWVEFIRFPSTFTEDAVKRLCQEWGIPLDYCPSYVAGGEFRNAVRFKRREKTGELVAIWSGGRDI